MNMNRNIVFISYSCSICCWKKSNNRLSYGNILCSILSFIDVDIVIVCITGAYTYFIVAIKVAVECSKRNTAFSIAKKVLIKEVVKVVAEVVKKVLNLYLNM